jgi:hypothetical protein
MTSAFVMTSDYGTHPSDKWADMISRFVFPLSPEMEQTRRLAAKSVQARLAEALDPLCHKVLAAERSQLWADAQTRVNAAFDGEQFLDDAVGIVFAITDETDWGKYMQEHEDMVRAELLQAFNAMQDVERLHHQSSAKDQ